MTRVVRSFPGPPTGARAEQHHAGSASSCPAQLIRSAPTAEHRMRRANSPRTVRHSAQSPTKWGHRLTSDPLDTWLGATWSTVPAPLRLAVVEHIFGADLVTMSTYAAAKARYVVERVDPDMRSDFEDVAQDTMVALTVTLPAERIRHWKTHVLQQLQWQVLQNRRRRTAEKRHPGLRVDYESTALVVEDHTLVGGEDRLADRAVLQDALDAIPHPETAAVLRATFVLAPDGTYTDVQTTKEVAEDLNFSQEKVKRLRAAGTKMLREALRVQLDARDQDTEEAS
ncbi:hypothetical protein DFR75_10512 [Nocardia ignorata]|uniref:Uncharacterized protein n=1 Tax=Nocardia ignorata TaxID=145285 RepID=A0A4R6P4L3_NOCIG|nr:hypothetical protein DFR75_10512 [Nocardia ignorata]